MRFPCTSNILYYVTWASFLGNVKLFPSCDALTFVWCGHLSAGSRMALGSRFRSSAQAENHWFSANRAILEKPDF